MKREEAKKAIEEIAADPIGVIRKHLGSHAAQYADYHLPRHMHGALARYLVLGISPGNFLDSVLENNLAAAASYADDINAKYLKEWGVFVANHMPMGSWGSVDNVRKWRGFLNMVDES